MLCITYFLNTVFCVLNRLLPLRQPHVCWTVFDIEPILKVPLFSWHQELKGASCMVTITMVANRTADATPLNKLSKIMQKQKKIGEKRKIRKVRALNCYHKLMRYGQTLDEWITKVRVKHAHPLAADSFFEILSFVLGHVPLSQVYFMSRQWSLFRYGLLYHAAAAAKLIWGNRGILVLL